MNGGTETMKELLIGIKKVAQGASNLSKMEQLFLELDLLCFADRNISDFDDDKKLLTIRKKYLKLHMKNLRLMAH